MNRLTWVVTEPLSKLQIVSAALGHTHSAVVTGEYQYVQCVQYVAIFILVRFQFGLIRFSLKKTRFGSDIIVAYYLCNS